MTEEELEEWFLVVGSMAFDVHGHWGLDLEFLDGIEWYEDLGDEARRRGLEWF